MGVSWKVPNGSSLLLAVSCSMIVTGSLSATSLNSRRLIPALGQRRRHLCAESSPEKPGLRAHKCRNCELCFRGLTVPKGGETGETVDFVCPPSSCTGGRRWGGGKRWGSGGVLDLSIWAFCVAADDLHRCSLVSASL